MPQLIESGALNTAALPVPDLYVQIAQPETLQIAGLSSGLLGIIGTASWGPPDTPTILGSVAQCRETFGGKRASISNLNLAVDIAVHQGASQFCLVRVTDGTDICALGMLDNARIRARHTGSAGNGISLTLARQNYRDGVFVLTVSHEELGMASYQGMDWLALQKAVADDTRALVVIEPTDHTAIDSTGTITLAGGNDGAEPPVARLIGLSEAKTGLQALANQGCAIAVLAGTGDASSMTAMLAFGQAEAVYMVGAGPKGETPAQAIQSRAASGLSSPVLKYMHGDWLWWNDDTLGLQLVSPAIFAAAKLAAL